MCFSAAMHGSGGSRRPRPPAVQAGHLGRHARVRRRPSGWPPSIRSSTTAPARRCTRCRRWRSWCGFAPHDRAVFDAARRWVGVKELIIARLTGEWLIDHSCASAGPARPGDARLGRRSRSRSRGSPRSGCAPVSADDHARAQPRRARATGLGGRHAAGDRCRRRAAGQPRARRRRAWACWPARSEPAARCG